MSDYKKSGVYAIINRINDKLYIGGSKNVLSRWSRHKHHLKLNNHHSKHLQNAWNKYGEDNFEFRILELVKNENLLALIEQLWLSYFESFNKKYGYNICSKTYSLVGIKRSIETCRKLSIAKKGIKLSEETKLKISLAKLGKRHPHSSYVKGGLARRGIKRSADFCLKISMRNKGTSFARKLDKWPCPKGSKCKCQSCKTKTTQLAYANREKRKISHG